MKRIICIRWSKPGDNDLYCRYTSYSLDVPTNKIKLSCIEQLILDMSDFFFTEHGTVSINTGTYEDMDDLTARKLIREYIAFRRAKEQMRCNAQRYDNAIKQLQELHAANRSYIIHVKTDDVYYVLDSDYTTISFVNGYFRAKDVPTLYCTEISDIKIREKAQVC